MGRSKQTARKTKGQGSKGKERDLNEGDMDIEGVYICLNVFVYACT
jgi:hypothetical protein